MQTGPNRPPLPPVALFFAVPQESKFLPRPWKIHDAVTVVHTGMGRANVARCLEPVMTRIRPGAILTCGFCGALNPEFECGTILVDELGSPALVEAFEKLGARRSRFTCEDRVAVTRQEKAALRERTGAGAVEMESLAIHERAVRAEIPVITARVVSDTAREDLPLDFNACLTADKNMNWARLFWEIGTHPGSIPKLRRFQKQTEFAARRLGEFLDSFLDRFMHGR